MGYKIIGKYIKELDFKIPNPKIFSLLSKSISNYKINIDIKSNQLKERIIEIEINDNISGKKEIEKIILIDVPSKVYPELRKIFIFVFENSGFKDIKISNNVDFENLYNFKKSQ